MNCIYHLVRNQGMNLVDLHNLANSSLNFRNTASHIQEKKYRLS